MNVSEKLAVQLVDFIYDEADLLDQAQYDQWLDLFSDDGLYWIPSEPEQKDPYNCTSHLFDDKLMRRLRVERLGSARASLSSHAPGAIIFCSGRVSERLRAAITSTSPRQNSATRSSRKMRAKPMSESWFTTSFSMAKRSRSS